MTPLPPPPPRAAMVVGLASGVSAAAVASHGVERMDVLEISPEVLEASRFFDGINGEVVRRPGVRVILEDGRTHIEHSRETYDVIVSEPTNPWIAGVSNLFTVEYFRACRERLAEGGVLGVWIQSYSIGEEDFRRVIRTVREVFPGLTVWEASPYQDYVLLAPKDDAADLVAGMASRGIPPAAADSLALAGVRSPETILALLYTGREGTARLAGEGPLHTDDRLQLEFDAPRGVFGDPGYPTVSRAAMDAARETPSPALSLPGVDADALRRALEARALARRAWLALDATGDPGTRARRLDSALADRAALRTQAERMPPALRRRVLEAAQGRREAMEVLVTHLLWNDAIVFGEGALRLNPGDRWAADALARTLLFRGGSLLDGGFPADAEGDFRRACDLQPWNATAWVGLALCHCDLSRGDPKSPRLVEALEEVERTLALHPAHEEALALKGVVLAVQGKDAPAEEAFRRALEIRPDSTRAMGHLAKLRVYQGRKAEAAELARRALALDPRNRELLSVQKEAGAR